MKHKKIFSQLFLALGLLMGVAMTSCGDSVSVVETTETDKIETPRETTVLVYAVASNNLYGNLLQDKGEMLLAAKNMDLAKSAVLVYQVTPSGDPELQRIVCVEADSVAFETVKTYSRDLYSTDPERISTVIADVREMTQSDTYGLILWSHGKGWTPSFSQHPTRTGDDEHPVLYSFGSDNDPDKDAGYYDETDIDELADAIPDHFFHFIWFDACYMSGIETIYQLREKCDYFCGYPTEVYSPGMPYDLTLPYMMRKEPDLKGAAKAFFTYYSEYPKIKMRAATIALLDMSKIEPVADFCSRAYVDATSPSASELQLYSRGRLGPFYDFGQYTRLMASTSYFRLSDDEFDEVMADFVIYAAATELDFSYEPISAENYSGISCHLLDRESLSSATDYYKTLDWYKRVYTGHGVR